MLLILAATLSVYRGAFAGFFEQDDFGWLLDSRFHTFNEYLQCFLRFNPARAYRPLSQETLFWVGQHLFGLHPLGFHVMSVCFHLLGTALVFVMLRLFFPVAPALVAAAFYGLHNAHFRSVYWISAAPEPMALVFYVSAVIAFIRFDRTRAARHYALSLACAVLGVMCKESILSLPVVLAVYSALFARRLLVWTVPHFAIPALYACLRLASDLNASPYALTFGRGALANLLAYLSWAAGASETLLRIGWRGEPAGAYRWVGAAVVLAVALMVWLSNDRRLALFSLSWFAAALQPVLYFSQHIFPYYLAPALAALSLLIAGAIAGRGRLTRPLASVAVLGLVLVTAEASTRVEGAWWNARSFIARDIAAQMPQADREVPPGERAFIFGLGEEEFGAMMDDAALKCYGYFNPRFILLGLDPTTPPKIMHLKLTGELRGYSCFLYSRGKLANTTEDFVRNPDKYMNIHAIVLAFDEVLWHSKPQPGVRIQSNLTEVRAGKDNLVLQLINLRAPTIDLAYTLNGEKMTPVRNWALENRSRISVFVGDTTPRGVYRYIAVRDSSGRDPWIPIDISIRVK